MLECPRGEFLGRYFVGGLGAEGVLEEAVGFGHGGVLMKALVTGGAGFIGSHLVEGLVENIPTFLGMLECR